MSRSDMVSLGFVFITYINDVINGNLSFIAVRTLDISAGLSSPNDKTTIVSPVDVILIIRVRNNPF